MPNTKTYNQLPTLLRDHYKATRLKTAKRYKFRSATQKPGQSIVDFVRELKRLARTCEFTNEQPRDSGFRDRGFRSEQIKRKLLSAHFSFEEEVDAAIAQEIAQKDVRDFGAASQGENVCSSIHKVKRDNGLSRGRLFGRHQGEQSQQSQTNKSRSR